MARFTFRLKPVLELRRHLEQESRDALARERQVLSGLQDEGKRLSGEFKFWSRRYMKSAETGISPQEAVRISSYIEELNRLTEENAKAVARQNAVVEKERLALIEKMKDRKTIETLYDKQLAAFTENERKKAEKETEEIIAGRLYAQA